MTEARDQVIELGLRRGRLPREHQHRRTQFLYELFEAGDARFEFHGFAESDRGEVMSRGTGQLLAETLLTRQRGAIVA